MRFNWLCLHLLFEHSHALTFPNSPKYSYKPWGGISAVSNSPDHCLALIPFCSLCCHGNFFYGSQCEEPQSLSLSWSLMPAHVPKKLMGRGEGADLTPRDSLHCCSAASGSAEDTLALCVIMEI